MTDAPPVPRRVSGMGDLLRAVEDVFGWATRFRQWHVGQVVEGSGSPEGAVAAAIGALYLRRDGGAGTTLYVKEADSGLKTGWSAK